MASEKAKPRKRSGTIQRVTHNIEKDAGHHLTGSFLPQTPLGGSTPIRNLSPTISSRHRGFTHRTPPWWLNWVVNPYDALRLLVIPVVFYWVWKLVVSPIAPTLPNPFAPLLRLSGYVETSKPDDPRYSKSYLDLAFLAYHIVLLSFFRESLSIKVSRPLARYFGLKKEAKVVRFAEQFYAVVYFSMSGTVGYFVMAEMPTYWYKTDEFWIDYPHWAMKPLLKRYYLVQTAYWCHQFIILVLGLEKPRKDYYELVAHHFVTLWLVGWSYLLNFTFIGCAVYMSMDIPDAFFAASKLLNYIQWDRAKMVSFVTFIGIWTYFRHYLNIKILWSVWFDSHRLTAPFTKDWNSDLGVYMTWWMPQLIFVSLFALQLLNLFWSYLIWRVLIRAIITSKADDDRSDDEDEDEASNDKAH